MKKWILVLLAPLTFLWSCIDNKPIDYLPYVVGEWTLVDRDDAPYVTDSIKIMNIKPDFSVSYAYGVPQSDGRMVWEKRDGLNFKLNDITINLQSTPSAKDEVKVKMTIDYISSFQMICSLDEMKINGHNMWVDEELNFEKSVVNLKNDIVGIWKSAVLEDGTQWYWNLKSGGLYDFYVYDPINKVYISKVENKSTYDLYGRYIVCQYTDSVVGDPQGVNADAYLISDFTPVSMVWSSRNSKGVTDIYPLVRSRSLPEGN